eukprot:SAG31_NODE_44271_length_263_cov_0.945122_1_plen_51_part_01
MYYPNGASLEMGPTAVCPGSMYFGRDLRGAPDLSESSSRGSLRAHPPAALA